MELHRRETEALRWLTGVVHHKLFDDLVQWHSLRTVAKINRVSSSCSSLLMICWRNAGAGPQLPLAQRYWVIQMTAPLNVASTNHFLAEYRSAGTPLGGVAEYAFNAGPRSSAPSDIPGYRNKFNNFLFPQPDRETDLASDLRGSKVRGPYHDVITSWSQAEQVMGCPSGFCAGQ